MQIRAAHTVSLTQGWTPEQELSRSLQGCSFQSLLRRRGEARELTFHLQGTFFFFFFVIPGGTAFAGWSFILMCCDLAAGSPRSPRACRCGLHGVGLSHGRALEKNAVYPCTDSVDWLLPSGAAAVRKCQVDLYSWLKLPKRESCSSCTTWLCPENLA